MRRWYKIYLECTSLNFSACRALILQMFMGHIFHFFLFLIYFLSRKGILEVHFCWEEGRSVWRKSLGWKLQKLSYMGAFSHLVNILSSFVTSSPELRAERFLWRWFSQTPWSHILNTQSHCVLFKRVVKGWRGPSWGQSLVMMNCIVISFLLCHLTIYRCILQLRIFYDSIFLYELFHCYWHVWPDN